MNVYVELGADGNSLILIHPAKNILHTDTVNHEFFSKTIVIYSKPKLTRMYYAFTIVNPYEHIVNHKYIHN